MAGILRIATKYCITHLRTEAIRHLTKTWTHTLSGHDTMLELALKTPPVHGLSYPFVHPLHVLHLARETDVRIIIPSALYFLSLYPLTDLLRADHPKLLTAPRSRLSSELTPQDLTDYTLMYQHRISALIDFARRICAERTKSAECKGGRDGQDCLKAFASLSGRLSVDWQNRTGPLHFMVQGMELLASYPTVCAPCRKAFRQDVTATRADLWRSLPMAVNLPPWEELERDLRPN